MPAKPNTSDDAGIFMHGRNYWLRYTFNRVQYKENLGTSDIAVAIQKARELRKGAPPGKRSAGKWDQEINHYCKEKQDPRAPRPPHLGGRPLKSFRPTTASNTASCISVFAKWSGVASPGEIKLKHLQDYYHLYRSPRPLTQNEIKKYEAAMKKPKKLVKLDNLGLCWKGSEASARSKIRTIQAFLDHVQCLPGRVVFAAGSKAEAREVKVPWETYQKLIKECRKEPEVKPPTKKMNPEMEAKAEMVIQKKKEAREDLTFVLYCGFHCGMRAGEIKHCRPEWINMEEGILTVPGKELQTLPSGKQHQWKNKDAETRSIPISREFMGFLETFRGMKQKFCLLSRGRSKSGLYDWNTAFESFMQKQNHPEIIPHAMRHSWITYLCNCGNHTIQDVAAWSGDDIETIQKNYWEKRAVKGSLDDTMAGKRSGDALKEVTATLKTMSTAGLDKETTTAIKKLLAATQKSNQPKWDWTKEAPAVHVRLYSVEDTISNFGAFTDLVNPKDFETDPSVTQEDWEEGKLSTPRARLRVLEDMGLIKQA